MMTKRFFFASAVLFSIASCAVAQKPVKGDKGFTFGVKGINIIEVNTSQGNTGSLTFKYRLTDDIAARLGIRYSYDKNTTNNRDTTITGLETTYITKSSGWAFVLGAQKSFGKNAKLEPFMGADIWLGGTNGSSDSLKTVINKKGGTEGDKEQKVISDIGKNFQMGVTSFVGFEYFFTEYFAFGAEFGYEYSYSSIKGSATKIKRTGTGNTFGQEGEINITDAATSKNSTFGTSGKGTISISVYF